MDPENGDEEKDDETTKRRPAAKTVRVTTLRLQRCKKDTIHHKRQEFAKTMAFGSDHVVCLGCLSCMYICNSVN